MGPKNSQIFKINPFQTSVAFHIETSHLLCSGKQMAGFYMKCNIPRKGLRHYLSHALPHRDFLLELIWPKENLTQLIKRRQPSKSRLAATRKVDEVLL